MKQLKMIVGAKPSDEWRTPPALFDAVEGSFGQRWVDMAATAENSLCQAFVGPGSALGNNALVEDWEYLWRTLGPLWCNPPYSQPLLAQFVYRFLGARVDAVMLVPASVETKWFQDVMTSGQCHEVWFIRQRVPYVRPETGKAAGAMFPSCLLVKTGSRMKRRQPYVDYWTWKGGRNDE